ncbi:uncharacterized protein SCHCODRAFT_02622047 [Schizophyllum commune H4-8]|uniref:uncharacterized protein n=1 Tax=Schizophyllum commune (strain H4-8 / FGSC 9210) TaxID=578458 RepID=UPI00215F3553|nr:uncharacterized protein SCHCODRAFT_02622047 [Schizophyllum commune H4-8]KAI5893523.1 hypothetical protein SCHCODRAFT_02622047 [Schizophyllum commune H4-8]
MDPTSKFQEALHVALLPVAPGLSATHATRCRRTETQASLQNACSKCGAYSLEGMARIRISRSPSQASECKASTSKILTKTCGLCGWIDTLAIPPQSNASTFPRLKRGRRVGATSAPRAPPPHPTQVLEPPPVAKHREVPAPASSSAPATLQATRPRPKKKKSSALQEMLARNKQNAQSQSKESSGVAHGKLAAFLSDL